MLPFKKDLKLVKSLQQKKYRREHRLFVVEGKKMVEEALHSDFEVFAVYSTDEAWCTAHKGALPVSAREMGQMTALSSPSAHLAVLRMKEETVPFCRDEFLVALDGIQDPGNMGTIIRTADWFGIRTVLASSDSVELYNPKTIQSTMGSIYRMNVHSVELPIVLRELRDKDYRIIGADLRGENVFISSFPEVKSVLVIGSESHGIRPDITSLLTDTFFIPGDGGAESLNAAVAAGILMARKFAVR